MKKNMAIETILKILQDLSLKARKKGIVVKMICPHATITPRNYMIILLNDKSKLYSNSLHSIFAVNLGGDSSSFIGISEDSYIVKPTLKDYLELWEMYTRHKKRQQYTIRP
jgi:hypothetical protein